MPFYHVDIPLSKTAIQDYHWLFAFPIVADPDAQKVARVTVHADATGLKTAEVIQAGNLPSLSETYLYIVRFPDGSDDVLFLTDEGPVAPTAPHPDSIPLAYTG